MLPATLQARQAPLQALLQQTPSTQKPLMHSSWQPQTCPIGFFMAGGVVQVADVGPHEAVAPAVAPAVHRHRGIAAAGRARPAVLAGVGRAHLRNGLGPATGA